MAILVSYLIGAIPTSFVVVRAARGVDLRTLGSGNLGATNLYRQLGLKYAVPVAIFDMLKGYVPVAVIGPAIGASVLGCLALGCAAVVGHVYSAFVSFRGGKGVATGAGVAFGLAPLAVLLAIGVWLLVVRLTGYVSLASILAALVLPPAVWLLSPAAHPTMPLLILLVLVVVWMHRSNIRRLAAGEESRFGNRGGGEEER